MKELLLATKNPGKYKEILEALEGLPFKFIFLRDLDIEDSDFVEDGDSFSANAHKKASYYFKKTGLLTLGEDSGILVDALEGELGVKTRRWGAGELASDDGWIAHFMDRMAGEANRAASFVCAAAVVGASVLAEFEGETAGLITKELQAPITSGIPLSSCFLPGGMDKVYAALSVEEKNRVSHRGKAMSMVKEFLNELLDSNGDK